MQKITILLLTTHPPPPHPTFSIYISQTPDDEAAGTSAVLNTSLFFTHHTNVRGEQNRTSPQPVY